MFLPHGHSKFFTQQTLRIFTATFASPCKLMKPLPKYKWKCCLHHSTKVSSFLLPALLTARLFKNKNPTTPTTKASKQSNSGQELRLSCCWLSFSQNFIPNIQSQRVHICLQQAAGDSGRFQSLLWVWDTQRFLLIYQVQFKVQLKIFVLWGFHSPFLQNAMQMKHLNLQKDIADFAMQN